MERRGRRPQQRGRHIFIWRRVPHSAALFNSAPFYFCFRSVPAVTTAAASTVLCRNRWHCCECPRGANRSFLYCWGSLCYKRRGGGSCLHLSSFFLNIFRFSLIVCHSFCPFHRSLAYPFSIAVSLPRIARFQQRTAGCRMYGKAFQRCCGYSSSTKQIMLIFGAAEQEQDVGRQGVSN